MTEAKRMTAQETVLRELRADIVAGVLRPGDQVVQESLAARYGVSRVPLREALKILEGEGLVVYYPHRGYFVMELSVDDLAEVYRLRSILEAEAIAHAVPQLTSLDCDALADLLAQVDAAGERGDISALAEANRRFHFAIFDAAGMPRLSRVLHQLWDSTDVYRTLYFHQEANRERITGEHAAMLAALRAGDGAEVIRLHDAHREHSIASARAQLLPSAP